MSSITSPASHVNWSDFVQPGRYRIVCPICGRGPRDKNLGLTRREDGFGLAHCFRCTYSAYDVPARGLRLDRSDRLPAARGIHREEQPRASGLSDLGKAIWSQCQPISDVALDYLQSRGCRIPPADGHLRWHSRLKHCSDHIGPALVALITDVQTGETLSLHRTWITSIGKEHSLGDRVRMFLPKHSTAGGVIRLWPDHAIQNQLGIGEGIETCLSMGAVPVWCALDAGHLGKFPVLDGIEDLYIARDRDPAGEQAAEACSRRWSAAGRRVWVSAQTEGDLNDQINRGMI